MTDNKHYVTTTVYAPMRPLGDNIKKQRQIGTRTEQKKRGVFNKETVEVEVPILEDYTEWVPNGKFSTTQIDHIKLAELIEEKLNLLDSKGYDVLSIVPYIEGEFSWQNYASPSRHVNFSGMPATAVSWGYSVTRGVIISAKLRV